MFSPVALFGIAIVSCIMSVVILGSLQRAGVPGLHRWIFGYAVLGAAFALLVRQSGSPGATVIASATAMLLSGAFLILQGTRQFFGRPSVSLIEWGGFAAVIVGLVYWVFVSPSMSARIALASSCFAYVRLAIGWTTLRSRPLHRPQYGYLFVSICAFSGVLLHVARGIIYGGGWLRQGTFFDSSPLNLTLLGLGILSMPCLSMGILMMAHDRLAERMERLATIDELTGALMRRAFMESAAALIATARATSTPLSVALVDLDHFKSVNDRFGHAAGDRALAGFGEVMASAKGPRDVFGRLGGEEFAVLLASKDNAEARHFMDRLRALQAAAPSNETACTFSAGLAQLEPDDTLECAMARADAALYAAKAKGRNCVVSAPSARAPADGLLEEL